jgi:hypothetical protein
MRDHLQTRRGLRVFAAATVAAFAVGAASVASAAPPPAPVAAPPTSLAAAADEGLIVQQVGRWGAGWLARQITAGGGHLNAFGAPDATDTAYAVVALHAAGVGRAAAHQAVGYLKTQLTTALQSGGKDAPGPLAYWILAATASGENPRQFGGKAAKNDLVSRLLATARTSGPDTGLFGVQAPTFDGAFRQGFALLALKAAGLAKGNPKVAAGIDWLERQQCANGLWEPYRADVSVACVPADPATFAGPDTNSSGAAIQGLAAYAFHPRKAQALATLRAVQSADGGFPFLATTGQSSDPSSTALVLQALIALKQEPASWGAFDALVSYQLSCSAPPADRGAFFFPGSSDPNILSTVQAVPALMLKAFPIAPTTLSTKVPKRACP